MRPLQGIRLLCLATLFIISAQRWAHAQAAGDAEATDAEAAAGAASVDTAAAQESPASAPVIAGEDGVRFNFAGEEWQNVLQWFADAAEMNLDWRELPEGTLNLSTQRSYSITEAHDILNLHLLTRGFTLLRRGDVLFLVKLDENLNPALVPRVTPDELDERGRYEYCKVSFPLDWMLAETAVGELEPMLSPYGRISPLTATNRIEVMDAAVNLREIRDLLAREQSDGSQERLVEEFILEHANAAEILEKVHQILGLEMSLSRMSEDQMETVQEQYEFRSRMIEELGDRAPAMKRLDEEVYLIANERKNSILANAAPDKIAIIRQAIRALDVPSREGVDLGDMTTMKVYPLNGAEADAVADILEDLRDIGKIHPSARFSEDDDRQILFAYASIQDHLTIESVMDQLAGSARSFKVIPLRQLRAAYVADSIRTLVGGEESDDSDDWRRRRRRGRRDDDSGSFRVEADTPNNRLFLFATDAELQQVEELLAKMGERSAEVDGQDSARVRVLDVSLESTEQALEQLRTLWPSVGTNPLRIEVPGRSENAERTPFDRETLGRGNDPDKRTSATERPGTAGSQARPGLASRSAPAASAPRTREIVFTSLVSQDEPIRESAATTPQLDSSADEAPGPPAVPSPSRSVQPPVTIRQGPNGALILSSDDTEALDLVEQLIRQLAPERRPYSVFRVQHASPFSIELMLEEIFAADPARVTAPMTFVSDTLTQSIMVFGAGTRELREVEELIRFYDQPQPTNPQSVRKPRYFQLRHADAESVALVIKDIYRDLLSANDRALARSREENERSSPNYVPPVDPTDPKPPFQGMLSLGVSPQTNTLIVSAPEFLANEIADTIERLDQPTPPTVTRIVALDGGINPSLIAQRLTNLTAPPTAAASADPGDREEPSQQSRRGQLRRRDDDDRRGEGNEETGSAEGSERAERFQRSDGPQRAYRFDRSPRGRGSRPSRADFNR